MKITIQDVAKYAKVSSGTISNALTGKRPVAESTRLRIMEAIEKLGYQPDLMAQGLVNRRSHVISIVITELRELGFYGYSSALTGIQRKANELGYSIMLHFVNGSSDSEIIASLNQIRARQVDGVIWAIHEIDGNRGWMQKIQSESYPPIMFLHMHPDPKLNVVSIDNFTGATQAVSHLVDQGCQKIGIITGPMDWWESQARLAGWKSTLEKAGLEVDPSLVVEGNWLAASGQTCMETLLKQRKDIDAVFACNDSMALGVLYTACHLGLSIPNDLLLVGYDDTPEAASFWPPLTSVHQGLDQSGQIAVENLHQIIEAEKNKPSTPIHEIIQPRLIIRQSSIRTVSN
jgi:LacI family transcriptional regulator